MAAGAPDTPLSAARRRLPAHVLGELGAVMRQRRSVLEIRDFVSGEFEPVPLANVFDYVKALAGAGQAKIVEIPEAPARRKAVPAVAR